MEIESKEETALGTRIQIKLEKRNSELFFICFEELRRIERTYSRFLDSSKLCQLNLELGKWQEADEEMLFLILKAEEFRGLTDGNFDITLKSALDEMGYDKNYSFRQKPPKRESFLQKFFPNKKDIEIDLKNKRVLLGKEIEFGGLGKGWALDRVAQILEENKVFHYYINAGGDILAKSANEKEPWIILLEHPDDDSRAIGKVEITDGAIAASAPNKRKWGPDKHHLLNAKTKKSANDSKAIFVLAKTGIEADAYATALFTAGFEEGIEISKKLPVEILFISKLDKMYRSPGFEVEFF